MNKIVVKSDQGSYVVTDGARTITLSGLSFTPIIEQLAYIYNKTQDKLYYAPAEKIALCTLSGLVITIDSSFDVLATGDELHIQMFTPEGSLDPAIVYIENPNYAHYTSPEHRVSESDLGLDGVHDGGDAAVDFEDSSETYTADNVAEGAEIYNVTDVSQATIDAGGAGNPAAGDIGHDALAGGTDNDWDDGDIASIPEVKRFVIPMEGYNVSTLHWKITAGANNTAYMKLFATLNEDADDTDDTDWVDVSSISLGSAVITAAAGSTEEDIAFLTTPRAVLKYMVKIYAECSDGVQSNQFDVYIKKAS